MPCPALSRNPHSAPAARDASSAAAVSRYLGVRVPRYTSYPTAPHFSAAVGERNYRCWLAGLAPGARLSLYLHVPFCRELCWYCGCNMKLARRPETIAAYVDRLLEEAALLSAALDHRHRIGHIHWGGGTPTLLSHGDFACVDRALRAAFEVSPQTSVAVEIDPRTLERETVAALADMGCTRASLGVQEFDPAVQAAVNRIQPFGMVARAVFWLRAVGISQINFDLIYGLPLQTGDMLADTVRRAVTLMPDRIALFGYAHVPWMAKKQRLIDETALPDPRARFEMAARAGDLLEALGYERIGIDHFALSGDSLARAAREGRLRRNFQGYTEDGADALLGLGASAISSLPEGYAQNIVEPGAWARAVGQGRLPVARGIRLGAEDRWRGDIIERLMCDFAVDLDGVAARHGLDAGAFEAERNELEEFVAEGLVEIAGGRVVIAPAGRPIARVIAAVFDSYLRRGNAPARHAAV